MVSKDNEPREIKILKRVSEKAFKGLDIKTRLWWILRLEQRITVIYGHIQDQYGRSPQIIQK